MKALKDVLGRVVTYTREGLKDVAEELPVYLGGGLARKTDRYQDKQVRKAVKKDREQEIRYRTELKKKQLIASKP